MVLWHCLKERVCYEIKIKYLQKAVKGITGHPRKEGYLCKRLPVSGGKRCKETKHLFCWQLCSERVRGLLEEPGRCFTLSSALLSLPDEALSLRRAVCASAARKRVAGVSIPRLGTCSSKTNIHCSSWMFWKVLGSSCFGINNISRPCLLVCLLSPLCFYLTPARRSPREKGTQHLFWWNKGEEQPRGVEGPLLPGVFEFDLGHRSLAQEMLLLYCWLSQCVLLPS